MSQRGVQIIAVVAVAALIAGAAATLVSLIV